MTRSRRGSCSLALAVTATVVYLPLFALLVAALSQATTVGRIAREVFLDPSRWVLFLRSLVLAGLAGALSTMLGLVAGYAIAGSPVRRQKAMAALLCLPLLIPPFVHALSWIMLGNRLGLSIHGLGAAVTVLGLSYCPVAALLAWTGFSQQGADVVHAARLGPTRFRAFWRIEVGMIRPHLATAFLLTSLFSFSDYGVPSLFRVVTYPVFVFSQFAAFQDLRSGLLVCWPYVLLALMAAVTWRWLNPRKLFEVSQRGSLREASPVSWRGNAPWKAAYAGIVCVTAVLPLLTLLLSAGSWKMYVKALETASGQVWTTLGLAAVAAALMVVLGLWLASSTQRSGPGQASVMDYALLLPVALPGTLFGLGLIFLWNRPSMQVIYGTPLVLIHLYVARFLPFAVFSQASGMAQIHSNLRDAARLATCSRWRRLWRVTLPLAAPAMLVAWALGFVLSAHELTGTLLVVPPGVETLAVRIYSLYHYAVGNLVAALCLILVAIGALMAALAAWGCRCLHKHY